MSREALSLEISRVVARVVSGEPIDVAERSAMLAMQFPDLGMSGEMIGEAIQRAAGMVGMIKSAPVPVSWPAEPAPGGASDAAKEPIAEAADTASVGSAVLSPSIEASIASSIDAEIENLVASRTTVAPPASVSEEEAPPPAGAVLEPPRRMGPMSALRRAFFGH